LQTGHHVEQRRLAGTVGADEPGDPTGLGLEVDVVDRHDPAEADGDALSFEKRH
jgi:hypothetical protein